MSRFTWTQRWVYGISAAVAASLLVRSSDVLDDSTFTNLQCIGLLLLSAAGLIALYLLLNLTGDQ